MSLDIEIDKSNQLAIGERIYQSRKNKKLSQAKLAEQVGMSSNSISNIENGKQECKMENIRRFAHALNITVDYIIYGTCNDRTMLAANEILIEEEILIEIHKLSMLDKTKMLAGLRAANEVVG